jgi:hypothetical protein
MVMSGGDLARRIEGGETRRQAVIYMVKRHSSRVWQHGQTMKAEQMSAGAVNFLK